MWGKEKEAENISYEWSFFYAVKWLPFNEDYCPKNNF